MRGIIRNEISKIKPLDVTESGQIAEALQWIDSGAGLFRVKKPATPDPHLVSYFLLVDEDHVLLVDHIDAELWLPTGGHVEKDENPKETVTREAKEELAIQAEFIGEAPLFLTITETVGKSAGHRDVSLWYVLKGDRTRNYWFDRSEFTSIQWFQRDGAPVDRSDPNLGRFLKKLYNCQIV